MTTVQAKTVSINGADLHVEVRGEGDPLLLLHGFTGSGGDWVHVFDLDALARRFRRVVPGGGHGPIFGDEERPRFVQAALAHLGAGT
jgi:pimeloyl-ACP methyl ester carboxylesterase